MPTMNFIATEEIFETCIKEVSLSWRNAESLVEVGLFVAGCQASTPTASSESM